MNFNPRSPCGERHSVPGVPQRWLEISIHAPRVGSDYCLFVKIPVNLISIHAPRVGSDPRKFLS